MNLLIKSIMMVLGHQTKLKYKFENVYVNFPKKRVIADGVIYSLEEFKKLDWVMKYDNSGRH